MARKHLVICLDCGRQFDANRGGYYIQSKNRYLCKSCGTSRKKAEKHQNRKNGQSAGAMIAKIVIGGLFVTAGFCSPEGGWTIGYFLTALLIGGGLIAWGLYPSWKKYRAMKTIEEQQQVAAEMEYNKVKHCCNCGATGTGNVCEYCGTAYK